MKISNLEIHVRFWRMQHRIGDGAFQTPTPLHFPRRGTWTGQLRRPQPQPTRTRQGSRTAPSWSTSGCYCTGKERFEQSSKIFYMKQSCNHNFYLTKYQGRDSNPWSLDHGLSVLPPCYYLSMEGLKLEEKNQNLAFNSRIGCVHAYAFILFRGKTV